MLMMFTLGCSTITFFMSALHFLLLIGMPLGEYVLGGKDKIISKEKRYINFIFTCIFFFIGMFYIGIASPNFYQLPNVVSKVIMILYSLFLGYAIIGNIFFTQSKKEKILMIPTSIICFTCSLFALILSWQ